MKIITWVNWLQIRFILILWSESFLYSMIWWCRWCYKLKTWVKYAKHHHPCLDDCANGFENHSWNTEKLRQMLNWARLVCLFLGGVYSIFSNFIKELCKVCSYIPLKCSYTHSLGMKTFQYVLGSPIIVFHPSYFLVRFTHTLSGVWYVAFCRSNSDNTLVCNYKTNPVAALHFVLHKTDGFVTPKSVHVPPHNVYPLLVCICMFIKALLFLRFMALHAPSKQNKPRCIIHCWFSRFGCTKNTRI